MKASGTETFISSDGVPDSAIGSCSPFSSRSSNHIGGRDEHWPTHPAWRKRTKHGRGRIPHSRRPFSLPIANRRLATIVCRTGHPDTRRQQEPRRRQAGRGFLRVSYFAPRKAKALRPAEIWARAAIGYHAARTRRVSAAGRAPTSGQVVTSIQSGSPRPDWRFDPICPARQSVSNAGARRRA